jgi:hypothetical protein
MTSIQYGGYRYNNPKKNTKRKRVNKNKRSVSNIKSTGGYSNRRRG